MTGPSGISRTAAGLPRDSKLARDANTPREAMTPRDANGPRDVNGSTNEKAMRSETGESGGESAAVPGIPASAGVSVTSSAGAATGAEKEPGKGRGDPGAPVRSVHAVYGALDLGTNNCRLLVAKPSRRGFVVVDAFSRIIRLGEGVQASGKLSESAMRRTIAAESP